MHIQYHRIVWQCTFNRGQHLNYTLNGGTSFSGGDFSAISLPRMWTYLKCHYGPMMGHGRSTETTLWPL
jgi:hypothetical protein